NFRPRFGADPENSVAGWRDNDIGYWQPAGLDAVDRRDGECDVLRAGRAGVVDHLLAHVHGDVGDLLVVRWQREALGHLVDADPGHLDLHVVDHRRPRGRYHRVVLLKGHARGLEQSGDVRRRKM